MAHDRENMNYSRKCIQFFFFAILSLFKFYCGIVTTDWLISIEIFVNYIICTFMTTYSARYKVEKM